MRKYLLFLFFMLFSLGGVAQCGLLKKGSDDPAAGETFEDKIPGDWDGKSDWGGGAWRAIDE